MSKAVSTIASVLARGARPPCHAHASVHVRCSQRRLDMPSLRSNLDWWEEQLRQSGGRYLRGTRLSEPDLCAGGSPTPRRVVAAMPAPAMCGTRIPRPPCLWRSLSLSPCSVCSSRLLFGHLQCLCASCGAAELVDELRASRWPEILRWARRWNVQLGATGYPWLHSYALDELRDDAPSTERRPRTNSAPERAAFWLGLSLLTLPLAPVTLLLLLHALAVRPVNRHASLQRYGDALLPWRLAWQVVVRYLASASHVATAILRMPSQKARRNASSPASTSARDDSVKVAKAGNKRM